MCGATAVENLSLDGVDVANSAVIQGTVSQGGQPTAGAYVRLLDATGEFTAEVVTSATGGFRFFARPGAWTLRVLAAGGATADASATAEIGRVEQVDITL